MKLRHALAGFLSSVAALLGACADSSSAGDRGALHGTLGVTLVGEVVLEESDTAFVGSPGTDFAVAPDGMLYVPDRATDRVYGFMPDGRLAVIIGRRGSGPGELRGVGIAIAVAESVLVVPGYQNFRVSAFHRHSGRFLGAAHTTQFLSSLKWDGQRLWFGTPDRSTNRTIGSVELQTFLSADSMALLAGDLLPLPREYGLYPGLIVFDDVFVLPLQDSLLIGTGGLNQLTLLSSAGRELRKLDVPVRLRRGVDRAALERYFRNRNHPAAVTFAALSNLAGTWRRSDGSVVVYHRDLEEDNPRSRNSQTIGRAFLTLLVPTLDQACTDAELPYPAPIYPRVTMSADTVFQLDQVMAQDQPGRVRTVVRKYLLDTTECGW